MRNGREILSIFSLIRMFYSILLICTWCTLCIWFVARSLNSLSVSHRVNFSTTFKPNVISLMLLLLYCWLADWLAFFHSYLWNKEQASAVGGCMLFTKKKLKMEKTDKPDIRAQIHKLCSQFIKMYAFNVSLFMRFYEQTH